MSLYFKVDGIFKSQGTQVCHRSEQVALARPLRLDPECPQRSILEGVPFLRPDWKPPATLSFPNLSGLSILRLKPRWHPDLSTAKSVAFLVWQLLSKDLDTEFDHVVYDLGYGIGVNGLSSLVVLWHWWVEMKEAALHQVQDHCLGTFRRTRLSWGRERSGLAPEASHLAGPS